MMAVSTEDLVAQFNYSVEVGHSLETLLVIEGLICQSLSPQMSQLFDMVIECDAMGKFVTSEMVSRHFGYSVNHASTMLKKLSEYQLVNRDAHVDILGLTYRYTVKGVKHDDTTSESTV